MRKIPFSAIALFSAFVLVAVLAGVVAWHAILGVCPPGEGRPFLLAAVSVVVFFSTCVIENRLFLRLFPLPQGPVPEGSRGEFIYHVNLLFYLVVFYPVTRSGLFPVPVMRLVYRALGAQLGPNTYISGIVLDPPLFRAGADTIIGQDAILYCHAIEGRDLALAPIVLGDRVTIGANAVVMSDVVVGDDAVVAAGAVVPKGSRIGEGEIWGGVPAKCLGEKRKA